MDLVVNDRAMVQQLRQAQGPVQLVDALGNPIGSFVPNAAPLYEPPISEEELDRREAQGGGRRLADIIADLEKKYGY